MVLGHKMFFILILAVFGKYQDGVLRLDSLTTEINVSKFSFSRGTKGFAEFKFNLHGDDHYFDHRRHKLFMSMYKDDTYEKYLKMVDEGSLCDERQAIADWKRKIIPSPQNDQQFQISREIEENEMRSHFVYFIIMDCTLEFYDAHPPPIYYEMKILNGGEHLPADEQYMITIHLILIFILLGFSFLFTLNLIQTLRRTGKVHLIGLLTLKAFAFQLLSVLFELFHLYVFQQDGKGLRFRHTWFAADFFSEIMQQISELMITVVLLGLSAGWTLNISVGFDPESGEEEKKIHGMKSFTFKGLINGLGSPMQVLTGADPKAFALFLTLFISQITLEIYGRKFEDDFNSFHDHEHLPGWCLMGIRILLGFIFFFGCKYTLKQPNLEDENVKKFILKLQYYGILYFVAFPILVIFSFLVEPYHRHLLVTAGSIAAQSTALIACLFTFGFSSSNYNKKVSKTGTKQNTKLRERKKQVQQNEPKPEPTRTQALEKNWRYCSGKSPPTRQQPQPRAARRSNPFSRRKKVAMD